VAGRARRRGQGALSFRHPQPGLALRGLSTGAEAKRLAERLEIHYTPKHGNWLNIAEIDLSVLSRQCLDRRVSDGATLGAEVTAWQDDRNADQRPIDWRFTIDDARIKRRYLSPSLHQYQ
jgi:hypothetical protein